MTAYAAPTPDMLFVINELAGFDEVAALPGFEDVSADLVEAVVEEAGKLAANVLAPLNRTGDLHGATLGEDGVTPAPGFKEAYRQFVDGGWNGLALPPEFDGQGLPELLATATQELWASANVAFALCPMLTMGTVEALRHHGSPEQQRRYLPKLVTGDWTGTMNLTEPQAGSDLSAVRTRAVPEGDHYRIFGQKIFITWGDHDMTDNIVHLVLARTPDAPEGVKGISLFIVPKFLVGEDGRLGERNDVRCASVEHKLGIHASPTCMLAFGDRDGAVGYLVGEENKGLSYMFTMMNEARLKVGLQGLALSERAYQQARDFARQRIQGRPAGAKGGARVAIIEHPDVRRMLLTMRSQTEAMRALVYVAAGQMDLAHRHPDAARRAAAQARVDLLIPVIKGWCTELGIDIASLGIQVHGGMGYVEETGAAQHLRDARITTIYEGTTGIQASDLVGRKLALDRGAAMTALLADIDATARSLIDAEDAEGAALGAALAEAGRALRDVTRWVVETMPVEPNAVLAASGNVLMLTGYVCGAWQMARAHAVAGQRLADGQGDSAFYRTKRITAGYYIEQILPRAAALATAVQTGSARIMALDSERF